VLGPTGAIPKLISNVLNTTTSTLNFNFIYSFIGVALIFSFFTYPYIYLLLCNSLKSIDGNLEDASTSAGLNLRQTFRKVILPLITPSIFSGSLLVIVYVVADFGAISMLRFESFTRVIYLQLIGRYDRASATILSSVLVLFIFIFLWIENRIRTRRTLYASTNTQKSSKIYKLNKWKIPCLILVLVIFTFTLFIPIASLIFWSIKGVFSGVISVKFFKYITDSLMLSLITAYVFKLLPQSLQGVTCHIIITSTRF
jgi:iron(III) transport system permease protein